nr:PadR family transcriptional regulator [Bifidobacterium avesanii]
MLALLAEGPKHGYELMQAIEERCHGAYVPSAGTVYPRLAKMVEDGLITKTVVGRRTIYAITDAGRAEAEARRGETERLEREIDESTRELADGLRADVHSSMGSLRDELAAAAGRAHAAGRSAGSTDGQAPEWTERAILRPLRPLGSRKPRNPGSAVGDDEQVRAAERLVYDFGLEVRDVLRSADAAGLLDDRAVKAIGAELDRARDAIRKAI